MCDLAVKGSAVLLDVLGSEPERVGGEEVVEGGTAGCVGGGGVAEVGGEGGETGELGGGEVVEGGIEVERGEGSRLGVEVEFGEEAAREYISSVKC